MQHGAVAGAPRSALGAWRARSGEGCGWCVGRRGGQGEARRALRVWERPGRHACMRWAEEGVGGVPGAGEAAALLYSNGPGGGRSFG